MNKNIVKDQSAQVGQGAHSSMSNNKVFIIFIIKDLQHLGASYVVDS